MLNTWNRLPIALRWFLLFPILFLITLLIGLLARVLILTGGFPAELFELLFPPCMALVGLFVAFHLAPNGKFILLFVLISLRSLLIVAFLAGAVFRYLGAEIELSWARWWRPLIGEILVLLCSIWLYKHLKEGHGE